MKEHSRGGRTNRQHKNKDQDHAVDDSSTTMDIWQYARQDDAANVEALVTSGGVDVDERNDNGETPLHVAAAAGSDAVVQVLLSYGADLRLCDWESGWTALHRSMYFEHLTTTLLLLRCARRLHGRKFMNEYLYDTRDHNRESAMEMISLKTSQFNDEQSHRRRGGMVYTFGKVDFQLGYHLPHVHVQSSPRLVELPVTQPIVQISASKFHTIALNACGEVFAWGFGKGGRLGTGTEFDHVEPTRLSSLAEIPIVRVAAGENHTLALSQSGQVFSWGSNSFGQLGHQLKSCSHESRLTPKRIDAFRGITMVDIAASGYHSGAVCGDDGGVYTWGLNKRGQLGRKDGFGSDQPNPTPRRVDRLVPGHALSVMYEAYDMITVASVAMSDVHTCVVLRCTKNGQTTGQVWQFGYGSNIPTRINFKEKRRRTGSHLMIDSWLPRHKMLEIDIVSVSCAPNHSIALSACGSVFTWGHNGDALSHELFDGSKPGKEFIPPGAPQRVALDEYAPVVSVCASQNHCAVVTRDGNLVSWGTGPQGVLGHGPGRSWQPKPKQVTGAKKVTAVAAGHQHTVLLVSPQLPDRVVDPESSAPPKLRHLLEDRIAGLMDLSNAATVWKYANVYSQPKLEQTCLSYMKLNWDALLEMGGKERLDSLFDLMLPDEPPMLRRREPKDATPSSSLALSAPSLPAASSTSSASTLPVPLRQRSPSIPSAADAGVSSSEQTASDPVSKSLDEVAKPRAGSTQRRKTPKFVPLDAYLQSSASESKPRATTNEPLPSNPLDINPWKPVGKESATPQAPPRVDSVAAQPMAKSFRPPRKESVDLLLKKAPVPSSAASNKNGWQSSPRLTGSASPVLSSAAVKQVLCQDGSERLTQSTFTLEAFVKKSARKKKRSDSTDAAIEQSSTWSAPVVPQTAQSKTLREIQAEEEARAAAEAAAKARLGGFVRKSSTLNSWGLVEQPGHVSLAELQRREEEERFLEEQRLILAQIQEENRLRQLYEQGGRASKKKATSKRSSSAKQSDKTPREEQKPSSTRRTGDKRGAQVATSDTTSSSRRGRKKSAPSTGEGESKSRVSDAGAGGQLRADASSLSRAHRPRKSVQAA